MTYLKKPTTLSTTITATISFNNSVNNYINSSINSLTTISTTALMSISAAMNNQLYIICLAFSVQNDILNLEKISAKRENNDVCSGILYS